jgi:hypothetical protein
VVISKFTLDRLIERTRLDADELRTCFKAMRLPAGAIPRLQHAIDELGLVYEARDGRLYLTWPAAADADTAPVTSATEAQS